MFDTKDDFIDSIELGMVALYLADRAPTDPIELKAGRNGEQGNPLFKGSCLLP